MRNAFRDQLIAIRASQREQVPIAGTGGEPVPQIRVRMAVLPEGVHHVRPDFPAASTQARTNRGHQVFRFGPEVLAHRENRGGSGALRGPAPTGMRGRHGAALRIRHEHGRAIGHPDDDRRRRVVAHDDVRLRPRPRAAAWASGHGANAVHLPDQAKR